LFQFAWIAGDPALPPTAADECVEVNFCAQAAYLKAVGSELEVQFRPKSTIAP
jgi:hypothetical protein